MADALRFRSCGLCLRIRMVATPEGSKQMVRPVSRDSADWRASNFVADGLARIQRVALPCPPVHLRTPAGSLCGVRRRALGLRRSEEHTSELQSRLHLVCRL